MSGFKHKGPLFYTLAALVAVVWGMLVYRIWIEIGSDPSYESDSVPTSGSVAEVVPVRTDRRTGYRADFRSPFDPPASLFEPPAAEADSRILEPPAPSEPPSLTLLGIIDRTAIVRDTGGGIHFLCRGQSVAGIRIRSVNRDHVVFDFEGHPFTLSF